VLSHSECFLKSTQQDRARILSSSHDETSNSSYGRTRTSSDCVIIPDICLIARWANDGQECP